MRLILIFIFISFNSYAQQNKNCKDYQFYRLSLMKYENKIDKPILIEFNYEMSESLKNSLYNTDIFNEEEQVLLDKGFQAKKYKACKKILDKVNYLQQKNGSYLVAERYYKLQNSDIVYH